MSSSACSPEPLPEQLAGQSWRLIEDEAAPGAWNMAVDDALLEAARRNETAPTLRLYAWSRPTLSLGRHQDPCDGIDHDYRKTAGVDLVRRPTGGRAVLHDREVTYSIILPAALGRGVGVGDVYCTLSRALLAGLEEVFGIRCSVSGVRTDSSGTPDTQNRMSMPANCFATAAGGDGVLPAGKLVGSAQARRAGAVLQHGSVLLEVREELWSGVFGAAGLEVPLAALIQPLPAPESVRAALRRGLERGVGARLLPDQLAGGERAEAERLLADRYGVGCLD
jgi:lipoyl(octanoyl) transferase